MVLNIREYLLLIKIAIIGLNRTENAMTQEHAFEAAKLCIKAQDQAIKIIWRDVFSSYWKRGTVPLQLKEKESHLS